MKMKLVLVLSFSFSQLFVNAGEVKRIADYTVVSSIRDKTLKLSESKVEITCLDEFKKPFATTEISYSYNGKSVNPILADQGRFNFKLAPGKYKFQFYANDRYYEIYTDTIKLAPGFKTKIDLLFHQADIEVISDKPVIYFYPDKKTEVSVKLDIKGPFTFTYPVYENGWNFTADPNGTLHFDSKQYNYLFWEGKTQLLRNTISWESGELVEKENLLSFLEEKLNLMGLSSSEQQDFITYWMPRMMANQTNYVHFLFNEEFNEYANLTITPKPDHLFRVYMIWGDAENFKSIKLKPQTIPTVNREGFCVLEWGGAELSELNQLQQF